MFFLKSSNSFMQQFGSRENLASVNGQSGARIYDMKHRTHLCWKGLSRAHGREGKNRRPRGRGIFIISTPRRHRPLRKAGECLKNNALMRFRPLILGLRSMQAGAQSSSLLLARKSANCLGDSRHSSARVTLALYQELKNTKSFPPSGSRLNRDLLYNAGIRP